MLINNLSNLTNLTANLIQSSLFNNDIAFINKLSQFKTNLSNSLNTKFFGLFPMWQLYLLIFSYISAPYIGKFIGNKLNNNNLSNIHANNSINNINSNNE